MSEELHFKRMKRDFEILISQIGLFPNVIALCDSAPFVQLKKREKRPV